MFIFIFISFRYMEVTGVAFGNQGPGPTKTFCFVPKWQVIFVHAVHLQGSLAGRHFMCCVRRGYGLLLAGDTPVRGDEVVWRRDEGAFQVPGGMVSILCSDVAKNSYDGSSN